MEIGDWVEVRGEPVCVIGVSEAIYSQDSDAFIDITAMDKDGNHYDISYSDYPSCEPAFEVDPMAFQAMAYWMEKYSISSLSKAEDKFGRLPDIYIRYCDAVTLALDEFQKRDRFIVCDRPRAFTDIVLRWGNETQIPPLALYGAVKRESGIFRYYRLKIADTEHDAALCALQGYVFLGKIDECFK